MQAIQQLLPHVMGASVAVGLLVTSTALARRPAPPPAAAARFAKRSFEGSGATGSSTGLQLSAAGAALHRPSGHPWLSTLRTRQVLLACLVGASLSLLAEELFTYWMASSAAAAALSVAAGWYCCAERAAEEAAPAPRVVEAGTLQAACGTWIKDGKHSTSMDPFFSLFAVSPLLRKAAVLMRGLDVSVTDDALVMRQLCALPLFSQTESFPLDGGAASQRRRDLRPGRARARLVSASGDQLVLRLDWDEPLAGAAVDTLRLEQDGQVLRHHAFAEVGGRSAEFVTTYRRRAGRAAAPQERPGA